MLLLSPFHKIAEVNQNELLVEGDLILLNQNTVQLSFSWIDKKSKILFAESPENGRFFKLWESTCFEAFFQIAGSSRYFEANLSPLKAWNIFVFESYRNPQPPVEYTAVDLLKFDVGANNLTAVFKFPKEDFKKLAVSICAVVKLKTGETSYWSTKHADEKPNFHHFNSFIIERNAP